MTPTTLLVAILGSLSGLAAILALFIVPASKRYEEVQERFKTQDARLFALEERNVKLTSAVAVLVQHDEMMRKQIKKFDPEAELMSANDILAMVGMSLDTVLQPEKKIGLS